MAKKKRSKKKTKKTKAPAFLAGTLDALHELEWAPYGRGAAWLLAAGLVTTGWILGVPRLERTVAAAATPAAVTIEFVDAPPWVHGDLLAMLDLTARHPVTGDPFRRADLRDARAALLNTGWFDSIEQVRRQRADLVTVDATFVRPAAVIRDPDGDHLIDTRAKLLPRTYPHGGAERQLVLTGAHFDRPARPGAQWDGADITAALRLLRVIDDRPWRGQVASIDVRRYLSDETLVIVTDIGARIVWGNAPGEEAGLEISAEDKLAYLDTAHREFRRIDTGHEGELHFYEQGYFAE